MTGPGPGGGFGPPNRYKYDTVPRPKDIKDLPRYLRELLGGLLSRLLYVFVLVWKTGPWILFAMSFIAVFKGVIPVIASLISKNILNNLQQTVIAVGNGETLSVIGSPVMSFIVLLFVFRITSRLVSTLSSAVSRIAGEKVVSRVKLQIMEKAGTLDLSSFDMPQFYEKLENANREAGSRPISVINSTFSMISTVIEFIGYIVVLATSPGMWWAVLVIIAVSVPSAVINFIYRRKNFNYVRRRSKDRREMNYYSDVQVNKDMVKEIRLFDLSGMFTGKYKDVFARYYAGLRKLIVNESLWYVLIAVISSATNCFFYIMIAGKVFDGTIMIGDFSLYTGALVSIAAAVTSLISTSASIYEGTLFIDNLISFMEEKQSIVPNTEKPLHIERGKPHTVEFSHVSFRYPGTDRDVLHDINLSFSPGETIVLVGINGAGKTTLIKLLTRLYDPTGGTIYLDGNDIRGYEVSELYAMFGIIFQDFGKYAFTARENITFGDIHRKPNAGEAEAAAEKSGADSYIRKLPQGYDTPLMRIFEETGIEPSIGQWQKLAIARAFYSDSDILILDEPTASLDPMAEQEIFNQFDRLREGKTTIFVSHRLSSATVADCIVVLENGCVIECGNHRELMRKKGRYCELFTTQAKRYIEGENEPSENEDAVKPAHRHRPLPE